MCQTLRSPIWIQKPCGMEIMMKDPRMAKDEERFFSSFFSLKGRRSLLVKLWLVPIQADREGGGAGRGDRNPHFFGKTNRFNSFTTKSIRKNCWWQMWFFFVINFFYTSDIVFENSSAVTLQYCNFSNEIPIKNSFLWSNSNSKIVLRRRGAPPNYYNWLHGEGGGGGLRLKKGIT